MFMKKVIAEECLATMNKLIKIIRFSDFALKKKSILYLKIPISHIDFVKHRKKNQIFSHHLHHYTREISLYIYSYDNT